MAIPPANAAGLILIAAQAIAALRPQEKRGIAH
jgi:hypothetical protein